MIQYVLYNPRTGEYKLLTSNGVWYTIFLMRSQKPKIIQVKPEPAFPMKRRSPSLSQDNIDSITQFIGKFDENDIQKIGGRVIPENNGKLAKYIILITLSSGNVYQIDSIGSSEDM